MLLATAKSLAIFFGIATTAFCISTIVLAVEKTNLENELQEALDALESIRPSTTTTAAPPKPEKIQYRLPNSIKPAKYNVYIKLIPKSEICEGSVSIELKINTETNLIVLHANKLQINSIKISDTSLQAAIQTKKFYFNVEREMLFIELEETLLKTKSYFVSITFNCYLDGLEGIYASSYLDANNKNRIVLGYLKFIVFLMIFSWAIYSGG